MPANPKKSDVAAFEARIREWVELYAPILGLSHKFIEIDFHHEDGCKNDLKDAWAHYDPNLPYHFGTLAVHAKLIKKDEPFQERAVIHELAHHVTAPLRGLLWQLTVKEAYVTWRECKEIDESVTDHVTQIVWEMVGGEGK